MHLPEKLTECRTRSKVATRSCLSSSGSWEAHDFLELLYGLISSVESE